VENVLLLDTSVGSDNRGDDIIMNCVRHHLSGIIQNTFVYTLPTHLSPFHWYQVARGSYRVKIFTNAKYKFVGGSNLLTMNMLTHFPQWNINMFNYGPLRGSILVGVGAGSGSRVSRYTKALYRKVLSHEYIHSVRDERTKGFLEQMGFKALNTGCATLWSLTPEHCKQIPAHKSDSVIFTLTGVSNKHINEDQFLIDVLNKNYKTIYYWIQGAGDLAYIKGFANTDRIHIIPPSVEEYEKILRKDVDYIGTRLHGGIYAMRHKKRAIIISIDERARGMNETYNLNIIDRNDLTGLEQMINSNFDTDVNVNFDVVNKWLNQFYI
jgi:polysaccharide pyruvyl transferase WcaK-like protein